jgi:hypothetical protein
MKRPIDTGMTIARGTLKSGEEALHERDVRRYGLALSVVLIAMAILAIRGLLHRIERKPAGTT